MAGRLIVVTGTGTGIGKTHLGEALLVAWGRVAKRVVGLKPIESGVAQGEMSDARRLEGRSTFHVKRREYAFRAAVSPHLAAREEGVTIRLDEIRDHVTSVREEVDGLIVELPGGLFTPLTDASTNADLTAVLSADLVILVAPDKLGVLHDVVATARAAAAAALTVTGVVLVTPDEADASTGRNEPEIMRFAGIPVLARLARQPPDRLAVSPEIAVLLAPFTSSSAAPARARR